MKRLMTALLAAVMTVTMAGTALAAEDPAALLERVTQKRMNWIQWTVTWGFTL